jgi:hypothetical protein
VFSLILLLRELRSAFAVQPELSADVPALLLLTDAVEKGLVILDEL